MLIPCLLIAVGFVLLLISAEYTVRGSVAVANKLNIPTLIIGLTIVAFGTSAPEFVISIRSAINGSAGISVGNVIGSNIANLMLILGAAAMIYPIKCVRRVFLRDYGFLFLVTALLVVFGVTGVLVRWHGILMLVLLLVFILYNYFNAKNNCDEEEAPLSPLSDKGWMYVILITILGLAGIIVGAELLIKGAVDLARLMGISEEIIGVTIIAFGTSLPELATSGMAAFRRQNDVALGNIIGSNVWNIVFILGVTSTIVDVEVSRQFILYDLWIMIGATILLLPFMYTKSILSRFEGFIFVLGYLFYLASQVMLSKGIMVIG